MEKNTFKKTIICILILSLISGYNAADGISPAPTQTSENAANAACPSNTFLDQTTNTCMACDSSCQSCVSSSTQCTSCPNQMYLVGMKCVSSCSPGYVAFTQQNGTRTCVLACKDGFYQDKLTGSCLSCDSSCNTCFGSSQFQCSSCVSGASGTNNILFGKTCIASCPVGYYMYTDNTGKPSCIPNCPTGYILDLLSPTSIGSCIPTSSSCSSGQYQDLVNNVCVAESNCEDGYFSDDNTTPRKCVGTCSTNRFGDPITGKCASGCTNGFLKSTDPEDGSNLCAPSCNQGFYATADS